MPPLPWLTIVGIGADGVDGLSPAGRRLIAGAEVVAGGARNLALAVSIIAESAQQFPWHGLEETLALLHHHRGRRVVVLASGDPMFYGLGATLVRTFSPAEMTIVPHPGAFSLAAARLGWPLQEVETLTIHGRSLASLVVHLAPAARLLVLSQDGDSPAAVAALLTAHGFGPSRIEVFEHLGGPEERHISGRADGWAHERCRDLNTLAIACVAEAGRSFPGCVPGLPDDAYIHDGQLTKREVRAVTLAALAPWPGALLWDIGAGAGSIAIEWLRAARSCRAVAVEQDPERADVIARNAIALGVPRLAIVTAAAPEALAHLPGPPDAVFVGGGVSACGILEAAWAALPPGGRLVANAVTLAAEARLLAWHETHGGELTRLTVARLKPIGNQTAWNPHAPITQYRGTK
ncbi:MAG: precorrin-6y C5,15-methyltransferase (decarboxylating) subunit CbiE [Alphaproteobacteria bacterium]|nr:precorrin-6y C5,15-methyltransferase (decarboxylating) subunit CbiE [Alphaproteobacteria bacterium]